MDVKVTDGTAIVTSGDILIGLWKSPASLERWKWHLAEVEQLAAQNAEGVIYLDLILPSSTPPDSSVRSVMQADFRRLAGKLRKLVVVPLGNGIWLSVVRTIVRGTLLISGQSKQQIVAATIDEGLDRVQDVAGPRTPSRVDLRLAIADLYKGLGLTEIDPAVSTGA